MGISVSGTEEEAPGDSEQVSEYQSQRLRWGSVDESQPGLTRYAGPSTYSMPSSAAVSRSP